MDAAEATAFVFLALDALPPLSVVRASITANDFLDASSSSSISTPIEPPPIAAARAAVAAFEAADAASVR